MLLSSIKYEIDRNISIYETGRRYFDEIEMENVNDDAAVKYLEEIEAQVRVTNQCGAEFLEVAALWENCFNLHGIDHDAWEKYDSLLERYHTEIEKLNVLCRKHKAVMGVVKEYEENMFRPIYELSKIFLSIIQKYMPVEGEQPQSTNDAATPYFDMALVSAIYGVCNGEQFEDIPELEFYNNLSLLSSSDRLRIRPKEKARVCYSSSLTRHKRMFADLARSANSVGVSHRFKYSSIMTRGIGSVESQFQTIRRVFKLVVVGLSPTTTPISYSIGWITIRARVEN